MAAVLVAQPLASEHTTTATTWARPPDVRVADPQQQRWHTLQRTAGNAALASFMAMVQRDCDPALATCDPTVPDQVDPQEAPASRDPAVLDDRSLVGELRRVVDEASSDTAGYRAALEDEARRRGLIAVRDAPMPSSSVVAAAGVFHVPGGPWHPPPGVTVSCSPADDCATLSRKIDILDRMIDSHVAWDLAHPMSQWPNGRHADEIADLRNAIATCKGYHQERCTNQPRWEPEPVPLVSPGPAQEAEDEARRILQLEEEAEAVESVETVEVGLEAAEALELLELLPLLLLL